MLLQYHPLTPLKPVIDALMFIQFKGYLIEAEKNLNVEIAVTPVTRTLTAQK